MQGITTQIWGTKNRLYQATILCAFFMPLLILIGLASYASLSLLSAPQASAVTTVPTKLNFQGRLSDSAGSIKPNGTYNMKFKLYTVATAGTAVWSEDRLVSATQGVTVTNGLFSVQLGSVTSLPASLFASGALYLEVELPTPATATSSTPTWTEGPMTPRNEMATSAYAYNSEALDGQDGAYYQDASNLNAGTIASARLTGAYTGITQVGTLTSLGMSGNLTTTAGVLSVQGTGNNYFAGNVGIGATTPGDLLSLAKTGATDIFGIHFYEGGGTAYGARIQYDNGGDILKLVTVENNVEQLGIAIARTNGRVGIGTATPGAGYKLDVQGGDINTSGALRTAGTQRVDASGNLVNIGDAAISGVLTQGGYQAADASTDNMVVNGDFERNNTTGWTGVTNVVSGGYAGNYAARFVGSRTLESSDYIPVDPTRDVFELEAYVKKTVAGVTPGTLYFGYKAYDINKTVISTAPCGSFCYFAASAAVVPVDGAWHKYSATTTGEGTVFPNFPVGTKYVRVLGLINYGASADAETLVDHVTLKRINHGPLFVGSNFSASNMVDQFQQTQLYTASDNVFTILAPASGAVSVQSSQMTVGTGVGEAALKINGSSTGSQRLSFTSAASTTWSIGAIGGGANPSFQVQRYNAGAYVDSPLSINNSTGAVTVTGNFAQASGDFSLTGPGTIDVNAVRLFSSGGGLYLQGGSANAVYFRNASGGITASIDTSAGNITVNGAVYASNWLRTYGATGWYNESYGGGWHMSDATWIRSYGSKYVYMDQGFDTAGASGVGCGGGLGGGYSFRVCGSGHTTGIMYAAGGTYTQLIGGGSSNGVCHNGADVDGAATGDMRALMVCNATPGDYAEFYPAEQGVEAGDLVATTENMLRYEAFGADPETGQTYSMGMQDISIIKKAKLGDKGIGIISTGPWQVIGKDIPKSANRKPVALNGRVPLKVNNEGGAIQPGDRLTLSSVEGYAKKATSKGMTYAVALEAFVGTSGKILVYVDNNYYEPTVGGSDLQGTSLALSGDASIGGSLYVGGMLNVSGTTKLGTLAVTGDATFQGNLTVADTVVTKNLVVSGHLLTGGNKPAVVSGQTLGASISTELDGTDSAGTLKITTATSGQYGTGVIARVTFDKAFESSYKLSLSAMNADATDIRVYAVKTPTGFDIVSKDALQLNKTYEFDYIVVGAKSN